jgi:hypothetical protein
MSAITKSERVEKLMLRTRRGVTQKELFKLTGWRHTNMRVALARVRSSHPKAKLIERDGRFRFAA